MPRKTRYLKLPYSFGLAQLEADLAKVREEEWISHFNTAAYENDWHCKLWHKSPCRPATPHAAITIERSRAT